MNLETLNKKISDKDFEAILSDLQKHPGTDMNNISYRTKIPYGTVAIALRIMVMEKSVKRTREYAYANFLV